MEQRLVAYASAIVFILKVFKKKPSVILGEIIKFLILRVAIGVFLIDCTSVGFSVQHLLEALAIGVNGWRDVVLRFSLHSFA